ncbi:MAG TPA: T9SS type A sorting domain-containing protein [Hanamia sp.]
MIDNNEAIATDTVEIKVNKSNVTVTIPNVNPNILPTSNAGNDTTAVAPVNFIALHGSGDDIDGEITGYLWTQISGPSQSNILTTNTASTSVSKLIAGTYEFELKVTDNAGGDGRDTIKVTIALGRTEQENTGLKVYPNPVHSGTHLEMNTETDNSNVTIRITDMLGRSVYKKQFVSITKDVKEEIDMSNLVKGTYVISVLVDGVEKESVKVMKL